MRFDLCKVIDCVLKKKKENEKKNLYTQLPNKLLNRTLSAFPGLYFLLRGGGVGKMCVREILPKPALQAIIRTLVPNASSLNEVFAFFRSGSDTEKGCMPSLLPLGGTLSL